MVKVKSSVRFEAFRLPVIDMLMALHKISERFVKDIYITSANDGKHSTNSYHFKNLALDIRTRNLEKEEIDSMVYLLKHYLGKYYDIVLERDHVHCEFDENRYERDN